MVKVSGRPGESGIQSRHSEAAACAAQLGLAVRDRERAVPASPRFPGAGSSQACLNLCPPRRECGGIGDAHGVRSRSSSRRLHGQCRHRAKPGAAARGRASRQLLLVTGGGRPFPGPLTVSCQCEHSWRHHVVQVHPWHVMAPATTG